MSTVIASSIPIAASEAKINEFFTFCGKIKSIDVIDKTEKSQTLKVTFEKPSAVSTALLLNGAEFEGSQIEVTKAEGEKTDSLNESNKEVDEEEGKSHEGDIDQESKPKSQVIAELLANGYVLQSSLVEKAVKFDQEKGISDRFKKFIGDLDSKYHLHEKNEQLKTDANTKIGQLYDQANTQWNIQDYWNNGVRTLNSYVDKFKQDKYGSQVHDFYKNAANDVKSVHEEATRLAELKKQEAEKANPSSATAPTINTITPESTTAQAAGFVPLEADKK